MPGGFVVNPPEFIRAKVAAQIPDLPMEHFDRIGAMYNVERGHRRQPQAGVRDVLQTISEQAFELYIALGNLSEEAGDELFAAALSHGRPRLQQEAEFALQMLTGAARDALAQVSRPHAGAPVKAERAMVLRLAGLLESIGRSADKRPTGDLVFLTRCVFDSYSVPIKDAVTPVRDALATIAQNRAD